MDGESDVALAAVLSHLIGTATRRDCPLVTQRGFDFPHFN